VTNLNLELGPKQLEVLRELLPGATVVAALINPTNPNAETHSDDLRKAARTLGLQLHVLHASTEGDFDTAFATLNQIRASAVVIGSDAFFLSRSEQLGALTAAVRSASILAAFSKASSPPTCPVQQSTKVELIINMKTAKTLGLTFPLTLLGRADEVIE
jgi:putative tryptophan/tyrosine transport system substrate-binding protein